MHKPAVATSTALTQRRPSLSDAPRLALRACFLAFLLLPPLFLLLPALLLPAGRRRDAWIARFERALLQALERGGPCLTKLGQWASTRPDLLPPSLCTTLGQLHHSVRAHSLRHTTMAIEAAFGEAADALFVTLGAQPVGSGCIAQVHEATERRGGRRVAIKVLHPQVARLVADDLYLMRVGADCAQALLGTVVGGLRWLALSDALDEFSAFMASQLDLRHEAANLGTSSHARRSRQPSPRRLGSR